MGRLLEKRLNRLLKRAFLRAFVYVAVGLTFLSGTSIAASKGHETTHRFRWRVPQVYRETVEKSLRFDGVVTEKKGDKGVLVFVFAGAVLLPYLAEAILTLRRDMLHGGITIDLRPDDIEIDTDKRLPARYILIVKKNGDTELHERDRLVNPTDLLEAVGLR